MANQIVAHEVLAMSSKEIADLTGKDHKNVIRDVRALVKQLYGFEDGSDLIHEEIQGVTVFRDIRGYVSEIHLDKDHTLTLLTGYDAKARMRVVQRWQELEAPQTTGDALVRMAVAYREHERRIMRLESEQVETKQAIAELVGGDDYSTAKGFARTNNLPADREFLNKVGRRATAMCRERGVRVGKAKDEVWGEVNSYPRPILAAAFDAML